MLDYKWPNHNIHLFILEKMTAWSYSVKCHIYYNKLYIFFYKSQFEMPFFKLTSDVVSTYLTRRVLEMLALWFGQYTGTD